eukprot:SAG11_NODE_126_length_15729_cov_9.966859_1_plen_239_part_00
MHPISKNEIGGVPLLPNPEKDQMRGRGLPVDKTQPLQFASKGSFRMVNLATPGKGKTNLALFVAALNAAPKGYHSAVVWSPLGDSPMSEWHILDADKYVTDCPHENDPIWGEATESSLFVIDDIQTAALRGEEQRRLEKILTWTSTHKTVNIILCIQGINQASPAVRRAANVWCMWPTKDQVALNRIASSVSLDKRKLVELFNKTSAESPHSFLCVHWTGYLGSKWAINIDGRIPMGE